jgi:hypothetical protein
MTAYSGTVEAMTTGTPFSGRKAAEWRGALGALTDPWSDYSASVQWQGASANPVIGNGVITARYIQSGKFVLYTGSIVMGSTTTFGTSTWFISLPVTPIASAASNTGYPGAAFFFDNSAAANRISGTMSIIDLSPTPRADFYIGSGGVVTSAAPFTWAQNDVLGWTLLYEAA